jgi:hypothetical protein
MNVTWKSWALTIGTAAVAILIATGHEQIVVNAVTNAAALVLWVLTADVL